MRHNGWRNCPSFSLWYLICFVTKVTRELIIWHIIFLQVSFWKIGFWQICHFVKKVIWRICHWMSWSFAEFVIYWIGHSNNWLSFTWPRARRLQEGASVPQPMRPDYACLPHSRFSDLKLAMGGGCLDHRNLQTLQIRTLLFGERVYQNTIT